MGDVKKIKITYGPCESRVYGFLFEQENESDRKRSAVILSHGYNSCQADVEYIALALAKEGYTALTIDFRGGGTRCISMGKPTEMSLKTEVDDLCGAADFLKRTREGKYDKLYLYGESQGGLVSSLAGIMLGDRIDGLFLLYPAFCIPDDMKKVEIPESGLINILNMEISRKYIDELPQFDVYEMMKGFKGSITIAHGDKDPIVNLRYAQRLYDQQKELGRDVTLDIFPGESHGFTSPARDKWIDIITAKLKGV